jgi:hypothetical protein
MKYTLILAFITVLAVIGCKKKQTVTHCYICNRYEVHNALIFHQFDRPRTLISIDTICGHDEQWIQWYMITHNNLDTIYKGTPPVDTVILDQHSSICNTN